MIEQTIKDDGNAFEQLMSPYLKTLFNYIKFRTGNDADANDIYQETVLSVWQSVAAYKNQSSFKTWVFSIARRRLADFYRKSGKNETLPLTDYENTAIDEDNYEGCDERIDVEQALKKLSARDNELVYLVFQAQLSYQDIAEMLNIPVGTVKSRMSGIKAKMRTLLSWER